MKNCLNCGKPVKNKFCNVSCQNKLHNTDKIEKKYGIYKKFNVICNSCNKNFEIEEREKLYPKKDKYYCSRSCANKRKHTKETKYKISNSLTKEKTNNRICVACNKAFYTKYKLGIFCSKSCSTIWKNKNLNMGSLGGLASSKVQKETRRSKNEIFFADLCKENYNNVLTNEQMFNGWDADVILPNYKVAVLWNGVWHYKKITKKHSIKQVENRDKIKEKEILSEGYELYIIKDMGKENKIFVQNEFLKFKDYLTKKALK